MDYELENEKEVEDRLSCSIYDYEDELESLKDIIIREKYKERYHHFLDETTLEDEYSHNDIETIHQEFIKDASRWIHKNYPNKFVLYSDWCVHLLTIEEVKEKYPRLLDRFLIN